MMSSTREPPPFVDHLLLFVALLRRAGLTVSPRDTLALLQALTWIDIGRKEQVYHAARSLLVFRQQDLRLFDVLFQRFFGFPEDSEARPRKAPRAPRHKPRQRPFDIVSYLAMKAGKDAREVEIGDRSGSYSDVEVLQKKSFSELSEPELETVRRLIRAMRWRISERRSRRRVPARHGRHIDLRRTLRQAVRHGGVPPRLPRHTRKVKQRPVVLLADISGSMEKVSRLVLLFFYSVCQSLRSACAFSFGTRLTHLTPALALRNVDRALDEATGEVDDWAGGTRIGDSLARFNRHWSRRVLRRGAVVIVVSDGWERGDSDRLGREMRFLQRRCHRLIWLNPLLGRGGYEPRVAGMAAALPFIDDFLPVHNLSSLEQLARHLENLDRRRGQRRADPVFPAPSETRHLLPRTDNRHTRQEKSP